MLIRERVIERVIGDRNFSLLDRVTIGNFVHQLFDTFSTIKTCTFTNIIYYSLRKISALHIFSSNYIFAILLKDEASTNTFYVGHSSASINLRQSIRRISLLKLLQNSYSIRCRSSFRLTAIARPHATHSCILNSFILSKASIKSGVVVTRTRSDHIKHIEIVFSSALDISFSCCFIKF